MIFRLPPLKIVMYRSIKTIKKIKIKLGKIVIYLIMTERYVCGCPIDKRSDFLGLFVMALLNVPDLPSEGQKSGLSMKVGSGKAVLVYRNNSRRPEIPSLSLSPSISRLAFPACFLPVSNFCSTSS